MSISSTFTHNTDWPADTVEFAPGYDDVLCLGTYLLHEATETSPMSRSGKLSLLQLQPHSQQHTVVLQEIALGAVTDIKWRNRTVACSTADGSIVIAELQQTETDPLFLSRSAEAATAASGVLALALDWSTNGDHIVVSHSDGSLAVLDVMTTSVLSASWLACDFECWAVAWDRFSASVVYSGGDDGRWKIWDIRDSSSSSQTATFTSKRRDAGVTTISPSPHEEHLIAVGSYDSSVSLYDRRSPREPLTYSTWAWHPAASRKDTLLIACMHDGFKVCDTTGRVQLRFDEHQSLAYGVDWARGPSHAEKPTIVASCSFYDHTLKIWAA
ncbi:WD40 repeat-like protein [Auriculariales sp. MPI-PUGE-AT-0066]|nr:WD40 repeat-like protein [Auriculariales sp. MPI-PUGE-AT-0066]